MATARKTRSSARPRKLRKTTQTAPRIPASVNPRSARGASRPRIKKAGAQNAKPMASRSANANSARARSEERRRLTDRGAEASTSRMPSSKRSTKKPPARIKRAREGTTPGGSPSTVLPATKISNTDVTVVPPPPDELPKGGAIADTDGLVRDVTGDPAENVLPMESLQPGEGEEPFDPPAESDAGSPGSDVENPADDDYTRPPESGSAKKDKSTTGSKRGSTPASK